MPYEKVGDNEPVCIADEVPFDIPDGWEWCRLKNLTNISTGKKDANEGNNNGNFPFFTCSNEHIFSNSYSYDGEYLIMPGNGANIGQVYYYNGKFEAYQRTYLLFNQHNIYLKYLQLHLVYNWKKYNQDKLFGSAIPYIKLNNLENYLVALPPLTEQQRIVTEIEKYLPLINKYDKLQTELDTLDKEFPEKLKKSILQQAIKGKLVEQDPSEEPASVLLDKIRKEKEKLIKEGKIKKDKNESIIYKRDNSYYEKLNGVEKCIDDEIPFEIPESWEWCRLGYLAQYKKGPFGSSLTKSMFIKKSKDAIKVYEQKNAIYKNNTIGDYYISKEYFNSKLSVFEVKPNEIIVSCAGTIGETYVLPNNIEKGIINQALMLINLYDKSITQYYLLYFKTIIKHNAIKQSNGSAIKNIPPFEILKNYLFPLPPLNEQNRIINAVNRLLNTLIIK